MASAALPTVRRALVVGLGSSGVAAVEALTGVGVEVVAVDVAAGAAGTAAARTAGATVVVGEAAEDWLPEADLVVPSPGVPEGSPVLQRAQARGIPVWSEPELAWRLHPRRLLAVTGTNGKTSVTELLTGMLQGGGLDAVACGNIGLPLSRAAAQAPPGRVLVAELSSFQLRFAHALRPEVGVLLNVAADHQDWHGSFEAYAAAKARLWQAQGQEDWAVANADDPVPVGLARAHAPGGLAWFSGTHLPGAESPGACGVGTCVGVEGGRLVATVQHARGRLLDVAELPLTAPHHVANVAAAACAALLAGVSPERVAAAARGFRPGRHRLETVATAGGVAWVDDSKATNPHAAAAALAAHSSVVWIAGGRAKGVDLGALAEHLGPVRHAVLLGEAADELADVCSAAGVSHERVADMAAAVAAAGAAARSGDVVLLAPACASFDLFDGYADRGERFAAAVRDLLGHDAEEAPDGDA